MGRKRVFTLAVDDQYGRNGREREVGREGRREDECEEQRDESNDTTERGSYRM